MPPKALKLEDVSELLVGKLDELKADLISEVRASIVEQITKEVKEFISGQNETIIKLESEVAMLQTHVSALKQSNCNVLERVDDNEQYSRRVCLRIEGIETSVDETSEEILDKVCGIINNADNCDIPKWAIDRAHRIGKKMINESNNKELQSIIVKFVTFNHRTMLYKARKSIKGVKIRLDLAKKRYKLLRDAAEFVDKMENIKFVFADINCRLQVHPSVGKNRSFSSLQELSEIVTDI